MLTLIIIQLILAILLVILVLLQGSDNEGLGLGGGGGACLRHDLLLCILAGLLEVLGVVVALHLLHVLGGGAAGGGRVSFRIASRARGVLRSWG